jgi:hypothetical protein
MLYRSSIVYHRLQYLPTADACHVALPSPLTSVKYDQQPVGYLIYLEFADKLAAVLKIEGLLNSTYDPENIFSYVKT